MLRVARKDREDYRKGRDDNDGDAVPFEEVADTHRSG
jgi:hypothetical protein